MKKLSDEECEARKKVRQRAYRQTHREKLNAQQRDYRQAHHFDEGRKAKKNAYARDYRQTHHVEALERERIYRQAHREELSARSQAYNKTHKIEKKEYDHNWRKNNPEKVRTKSFIYKCKRSGHTPESYATLIELQDGKCAICGAKLFISGCNNYSVNADHDHKTGEPRGMLCSPCNRGIGSFYDNPSLLHKAAEYLESYQRLEFDIWPQAMQQQIFEYLNHPEVQ